MHFPLSCLFSQSSKKTLFFALQPKKRHEQGPEKPTVLFKLDWRTSVLFQGWIKLLTSLLVQRSWNRKGFAPSHWAFPRIFVKSEVTMAMPGIAANAEQHRRVLQERSPVPHSRVKNYLSVVQHTLICECQLWWRGTAPPHSKWEAFLSTRSCSSTLVKEQLLGFIPWLLYPVWTDISYLCGFWMHRALKRSSVCVLCVT